MSSVENLFDINKILHKSFSKIESLSKEKKIDLIFEMNSTLPRELRGNVEAMEHLLTSILTFVFKYTQENEIVLTLNAPEDFLYEELISFKISKSGIIKEKVLAFLETELGSSLKILNGEVIYDENDIHLNIPFTIGELGFRRHYRLPSKSMLQKKVLLIVQSENSTRSITKMFKYFPYDVDFGLKAYKEDKTDLAKYDVVVIEESLVTKSFAVTIKKVQELKMLKCVILAKRDADVNISDAIASTHLMRPVTQESIFELIISLFGDDRFKKEIKKNIISESENLSDTKIVDIKIPKNLQSNPEDSTMNKMIEEKKASHVLILDTKKGLENAKKKGLMYSQELENFLETFYKSDLYFRQIVNEKQSNKIKDFCIDLEKQSKVLGAESMQKFADIISLIFVYDKLDMLPIYPGRYHIELEKLTAEIKNYLHIR